MQEGTTPPALDFGTTLSPDMPGSWCPVEGGPSGSERPADMKPPSTASALSLWGKKCSYSSVHSTATHLSLWLLTICETYHGQEYTDVGCNGPSSWFLGIEDICGAIYTPELLEGSG